MAGTDQQTNMTKKDNAAISKIKLEKIIQDITDLQSESIDNLNIDDIAS